MTKETAMQTDKNAIAEWKLVPVEATFEMVQAAFRDQPGAINVGFGSAYRSMLAASPPQAGGMPGEEMKLLRQMVEAIETGNIDSPELDGDQENGIPPHRWHEEWLHHARALLSLHGKEETGWRPIATHPKNEMFIWRKPGRHTPWSVGLAYQTVSGTWADAYGAPREGATDWHPMPKE